VCINTYVVCSLTYLCTDYTRRARACQLMSYIKTVNDHRCMY
jgi:hypothetical protein